MMMPVVCAAKLKADELAAVVVVVLDGLGLLLALAEGPLIRLSTKKTVTASKVSAANNFLAVAFFILFFPFPDIEGFNPLKESPSRKIREGTITP